MAAPSPVVLSRSRTYPIGVDAAFDAVLPTPLPELFDRRYGLISPITAVRDQDGAWATPGQTRTIVQSDGTQLRETLTAVDRPHLFTYDIAVARGPLRFVLGPVEGRWAFEAVGTGTRITWSWSITPASRAAALLMPPLARMWQGYARAALERVEDLLVA